MPQGPGLPCHCPPPMSLADEHCFHGGGTAGFQNLYPTRNRPWIKIFLKKECVSLEHAHPFPAAVPQTLRCSDRLQGLVLGLMF